MKIEDLPYPDLIPVLVNDSLFGYCDKDMNLKINPQFENAALFEEDFSFQILHVNNPAIVKYGTDAYAWVKKNGERYRIDKKGEIVYRYRQEDFKTGETKFEFQAGVNGENVLDSISKTTLFPYIRNIHTQQKFPDTTFLKKLKEKHKDLVSEGVIIVYRPTFKKLPYEPYYSQTIPLQGIKNTKTGKVIIKARYASIDELYNNPFRIKQYPLFIGYKGDLDKSVYVGLDGKEFVSTIKE